MKLIEKNKENALILLSQDEIHLIVSALGEITNVLDAEDCETRTGYYLNDFNKLFIEFNIIDER